MPSASPAPRRLPFALASASLLAAVLVLPAQALAHGLIQRANLPIPEWLFGWAAAIVLIVSFIALGVLWSEPRLENNTRWKPLPGIGSVLGSRALEYICGATGAFLLLLVLYAGFHGERTPQSNIVPTLVFITFWVGFAFASAIFGDIFRAFNPWRAIGRFTGWAMRRARGNREPAHRPYPAGLGRWPAVATLLCFTWIELSTPSHPIGNDPRLVAIATAIYTVITLTAQAVYGVETWTERGEGFSVYYNLFSRLSIFERRRHTVGTRPLLSALPRLERLPGTVPLVVVMIGTVTFDGLSQGKTWASLQTHVTDFFNSIGFSDITVERLTNTTGMILSILIIGGFYVAGIAGARSVGGDQSAEKLRVGFIHSLIPIALVYVAAHYFTFFIFEGQSILRLVSDPLGHGSNYFGTADKAINYGVLSQNGQWYVQVGLVVLGHVAALALAHDRALGLYGHAKTAVRSQYWMLGIMVGFTSLALWLLAQAGTAATVEPKKPKGPGVYKPSSRLVDFTKKPPYVNGLEIDPNNGNFLLTTNRGFWRIDAKTDKVTKIVGTLTGRGHHDTVGTFLLVKVIDANKWIGSGHPDHLDSGLPQFLGFIESDDQGKTWKGVSRFGSADLHKIVLAHDKMYAFDAVLSALLTSQDQGKTFFENFTPRGLIADFEIDPTDENTIVADTDEQMFRSTDGGQDWRPILTATRARLAWPSEKVLYRADQDGKVYLSTDAGSHWTPHGKVPGEPYKFKWIDENHLYLALSDGTILETKDGAKTWETIFKP